MRIISGSHKGRKLQVPKTDIEPTKDMVKEAVFNILGAEIIGKKFIDLFSGSGNIGIEALSRGAKEVFFVESNFKCVEVINQNLEQLGLYGKVIRQNVLQFLKQPQAVQFDFIFADPPYHKKYYEKILELLATNPLVHSNSQIILEHHTLESLSTIPKQLIFIDKRCYGITGLSFYSVDHKAIS